MIPAMKLLEFERLVSDYRIAYETYRDDPSDTRYIRRYLCAYQNLVDFVNSLLEVSK